MRGNELYSGMKRQRDAVSNEAAQAGVRLRNRTDEIGRLVEQEAAAWTAFAEAQVSGSDRLPEGVREIMAERERSLLVAQAEAERRREAAPALSSETVARRTELAEARQALERATAAAGTALEADAGHVAAVARLSVADAALSTLVERHERASAERDEKTRAYEADEIFTYLRDREGGQESRIWPFSVLDRMLARASNHREAAANHARLVRMPEWILERRASAATERDAADAQASAIEARFLEPTLPLERLVEQAEQALEGAVTAERRNAGTLERSEAAMADHAAGRDTGRAKAVAWFARELAGEDRATLEKLAAATRSGADDEALAMIVELSRRRSRFEREAMEISSEVEAAKRRASELDESMSRMRRKGWDSRDHRFGDGSNDLSASLAAGMITSDSFWSSIEGSHSRVSSQSSSSSSGSSGSSSSSGRSSDDGWNSGGGIGGSSSNDWSTGGGIGGDNSSTGGGF